MAKASGGTRSGSGNTDYRQMNRNNADAIKQKYNTPWVTDLINSPAGGMDLVGYHDDISRVFQQFGLSAPEMGYDGSGRSPRIYAEAKDKDGLMVRLYRSFFLDSKGDLVVDHDLFRVPKSMQGNGFSKAIMRALYKHYKEAGVKKIVVFANIDVGGYTWARYGFSVKNKSAAEEVIAEARLRHVPLIVRNKAKSVVDTFYNSHPADTPFPMNLLADKSYGKELLKGADWSGRIDLTDATQRKVFEDYMNGKRPKK